MAEEQKEYTLHISTSPHIRQNESTNSIMIYVALALVPSLIASIIFFGLRSLLITVLASAAAVGTEWIICKVTKKPQTISDFSALVTGMLVAFNVPATIDWWMPVLGSIFAIGVTKVPFGGLGHNFINPALAGRAFLMACYPAAMTTFVPTVFKSVNGLSSSTLDTLEKFEVGGVSVLDGISGATPLYAIKQAFAHGAFQALDFQEAIPSLFKGNIGGCIGETSVIALLLGAILLWYKHIIGFKIPLTYIGSVFLLFWLFNGTGTGLFTSDAFIVPVFHVFSGGLMLGALFMATDMVTSPITPRGKIFFGLGCGVLTFVIRKFGGYPEGVSYSILLMNCVSPLLDRYNKPKKYGERKKGD